MSEDEGGLSFRATGRQGDEGLVSRASNAPGVWEIPVHDGLKCLDQICFPIHRALCLVLPQTSIPSCPQQNPTIPDWCRPKSLRPAAVAQGRGKKFPQRETHSCLVAI